MAKIQPTYVDEFSLRNKVKGDLGDFQIIEERTDNSVETLRTENNCVSNIPSNLLQASKTSSAPVYGSVSVKHSENVHFGNNTYFTGPVTIKQVIHKSGIDNASYVQTDDDGPPSKSQKEFEDVPPSSAKKFKILLWHKLTLSALCLVVIGGISAVVSVVIGNNNKVDTSSGNNYNNRGDSDSNYTMVVGCSYDFFSTFSIVLFITLTSITFLLMLSFVLTRESSVVSNIRGSPKKRRYVISQECDDLTTNIVNRHKAEDDPLLIAPNHLRIVSRTDWLAQPVEGEIDRIRQPVPWVIISHTATESCSIQTNNCVSNIPSNLLQASKTSSAPVYGSVSVKHSENVHFGNNTYFTGPVTIKQVIHKSGIDNASYVQTDDDGPPSKSQKEFEDVPPSSAKKFKILLWHKLTLSALCLVVIGGISAVVSVVIGNNNKVDTSSGNNYNNRGDSDSNYTMVVGCSYDFFSTFSIVLFITLTSITFLLMLSFVLTRESSVVSNIRGSPKKRRYVISQECDDLTTNIVNRHKAEDDPLLIAPNHLRIVSRTDWLAQPVEGEIDRIRQPVPWVIISHTATESCSIQSECVLRVRLIQMFHIESKKWFDIGYNFLVAGDGSAYIGRGWDSIGAHTLGYNKYSIGIAFIGTFNNEAPPRQQLAACEKLIRKGVELGKLAKDYKLFAHRTLASTLSPGNELFDIIKEWPHFVNNFTDVDEMLPNY